MVGICSFTGCPRGVYTESVRTWCLAHLTRYPLWDRYPHLRRALVTLPDADVMWWGMGLIPGVPPGPDQL